MFNNVFWKAETSFKVFVSRTDVRRSLLSYPAVNYPPMLVHHCCAVYASCIAEQQTSLSSDGNLPFPVSVEKVLFSLFFPSKRDVPNYVAWIYCFEKSRHFVLFTIKPTWLVCRSFQHLLY